MNTREVLENFLRKNAVRVTPINSIDEPLADAEIFTSIESYRKFLWSILKFQEHHRTVDRSASPLLRCTNVVTEIGYVLSLLDIQSTFISENLSEINPHGYILAIKHFGTSYPRMREDELALASLPRKNQPRS